MKDARRLVEEALVEWRAGRHYEAHELLEDVAECFDDDDPSFDVALALVHVTAAFHKATNDVGPKAAPGKILRALDALRTAPNPWLGLDLASFVVALEALLAESRDGLLPIEALPIPATI